MGQIKVKHVESLDAAIVRYTADRKRELLKKYEQQAANADKANEPERAARIRAKSPNASVNRELGLIRSSLNYAKKKRKIREVPFIEMCPENNIRTGHVGQKDKGEYERLAAATMGEGLWCRTLFEIGYQYGWRREELLGRKVSDCDFLDGPNGVGTIALPGLRWRDRASGTTKNGEPRIVSMTKVIRELCLMCCAGKGPEDYLLTRQGPDGRHHRIVDYRKAWARVLKRAKIERHLLVHDLRRTAITNFEIKRLPRKTAMSITGHKTESAYSRYSIADLAEIARATAMIDAEQAAKGLTEVKLRPEGLTEDRLRPEENAVPLPKDVQ